MKLSSRVFVRLPARLIYRNEAEESFEQVNASSISAGDMEEWAHNINLPAYQLNVRQLNN